MKEAKQELARLLGANDPSLWRAIKEVESKINCLNEKEEHHWRHQSRALWLKIGDRIQSTSIIRIQREGRKTPSWGSEIIWDVGKRTRFDRLVLAYIFGSVLCSISYFSVSIRAVLCFFTLFCRSILVMEG